MGQQDDTLNMRTKERQVQSGPNGDLTALFEQLSASSTSAIAPILEANQSVEGVLKENGFARFANTKIAGTEAQIFLAQNQSAAIILVDDILIPGKLSAGGASLGNIGNSILPVLVLPHPSESVLKDTYALAALSEKSEHLEKVLEDLNLKGRMEVLNHELEHLADLTNGSPWGRVSITSKFYNLCGQGSLPPEHLSDLVLSTPPSPAEVAAATLVMELKAFRHNTQSEPERARIANTSYERIGIALEQSNSEAIQAAIKEFQTALKSSSSRYNIGESEAIEIAAKWITSWGSL